MEKAVRLALGDLDGVEHVLEAGALTSTAERFSGGEGLTAGAGSLSRSPGRPTRTATRSTRRAW